MPVVVVGGGSILIDRSRPLRGCSQLVQPEHFAVANAIGAGISQVSGSVDFIVSLESMHRDEAQEEAKQRAMAAAVVAGADPSTVEVRILCLLLNVECYCLFRIVTSRSGFTFIWIVCFVVQFNLSACISLF